MSDMAIAELRPRKITVDEYHRMAETGILRDDERVELLDGVIVEMSPIGPPHDGLHMQIDYYLKEAFRGAAMVSGHSSQPLGQFNEPQPDLKVVVPSAKAYFTRHPMPEEIFAVVEIADTSLKTGTEYKRDLYARFEIHDYLVADVNHRRLLHYSSPADGRYPEPAGLSYGDTFTINALPDIVLSADPFLLPKED